MMRRRKQRPLFIIDIAVPRNVDPQIDRADNIYLYDVDDLQEIAQENKDKRHAASDEAAKIIDAEVYKFDRWLKSLKVFPTIQRLKERLSRVSEAETQKVLKKLSHLSKEDQEWISRLGEQILNKVLHPSVEYIKWEASLDKFDAVELIEDLFALYGDVPEEKV